MTRRGEDGAAHEGFEQRQFIRIVPQRCCAMQRGLGGVAGRGLVEMPAEQRLLGGAGAVGHGGRGAQHDGGLAADALRIERQQHRDLGERPVEAGLLALTQIRHARAGRRLAEVDRGQHFARAKRVFPLDVISGADEEIFERQAARGTFRIAERDLRLERDERGRGGGGMHDGADMVVEDRMILVLAMDGEAMAAALAQAVMGG